MVVVGGLVRFGVSPLKVPKEGTTNTPRKTSPVERKAFMAEPWEQCVPRQSLGTRDAEKISASERMATMKAVAAGLARGCRFISRFGDSHGFAAHQPWLSPKRLTLLF